MADQQPVEIISEEEMAFLEAALASARPRISAYFSSSSSSPRRLCSAVANASHLPPPKAPDIEELLPRKSLIGQFRKNRGLTVTDITSAEWCEKQKEFELLKGKPKRTRAMQAGSDRHAQLEREVIERVEIRVKSKEESWALKFINFIIGANQLLFEGLTRELQVVGIIEGIWVVGIIDEIRIKKDENSNSINPILVDTKTRVKPTIPTEAQKRNARLQLMCYKYLWDNLIMNQFHSDEFFKYFNLDSEYILSDVVKEQINSLGFQAKTFGDVLTYFRDTLSIIPQSKEELILRYELQSDNSLLEEYTFSYDEIWFKNQIRQCLDFWNGKKEANFVAQEERWKCQFCKFSSICPKINTSQ
ncbi:hypothetical protein LUZ60_003787 [Juncus effusus]|nr:hypothetical protein LUZ60_003787 [Juncus effusus]